MGWRGTYRVFSVVFLLLLFPTNLLFQSRASPQKSVTDDPDLELVEADGSEIIKRRHGSAVRERPVGGLLRIPALWFLFSTRALVSIGNQMTRIHMLAFFILAGYSEFQAAWAIGLVGLVSMVGRPTAGLVSDVIGREIAYTVGLTMQITALVLVLVAGNGNSLWPIVLFVSLSGLSDGIGGLVVGAKAADLFPSDRLGTVMGIVEVGRSLGIALGPVLGGILFDAQGNYVVAFSLAISVTFAGLACMWATRLPIGKSGYGRSTP